MTTKVTIVDTADRISLPSNWAPAQAHGFLQLQAGRAYMLDQLGVCSHPKSEFTGYDGQCAYRIYEDDSLWFANNAADEVWSSYARFVEERLPSFASVGYDELEPMSKDLLLLCYDGEDEVREALDGAK